MVLFVALLGIVGFLSMAVFQLVRQTRARIVKDERTRLLPYFLLVDFILILSELYVAGELEYRLPFDMFLAVLPLLVLLSPLHKTRMAVRESKTYVAVTAMYSGYCVLCGVGLLEIPGPDAYLRVTGICLIFMCAQYVISLFMRLREIRLVMQLGNVWSFLQLAVEGAYVSFLFTALSLLLIAQGGSEYLCLFVAVLILSEVVALFIRLTNDSVFVFWVEHERRIVESMKISSNEVIPASSKSDMVYQDIYERVVHIFENDLIFLNSELTINEVVKVVFTNKLYISRAISRFTGRNFCQFVNSYRVNHSVKVFRENPELKVTELAVLCGFNSAASFNAAFKLFMGESPSDWCRKEKTVMLMRKK